MELKVALGSLNPNNIIESKQKVDFNTFDLDKYTEMFDQLIKSNHIFSSFDDIHWELQCNISDYQIIISFDIEVFNEYNLALKAYSIIRLMSGRTAVTVYNEVALIKKAILKSNGFKDLETLEAFLELEVQSHTYQGHELVSDLKRFVSFYYISNSDKIMQICNNQQALKRTSRKLPDFEDIMIFDEVVNDYFQTKQIEETLEFLPIMIWWLLSNIIPMRPSEFLKLEKDCLEFKENYSSPYRIKIPRIKNKMDSPVFLTRKEFIEIDYKTYKFIERAIQKLEKIDSDSNFLFPVELLLHFRKTKRGKKNKRINRRDFDLLKNDFYENIVEDMYGKYDLERIKSADTRHFAIINMALQGFNMLSIARMAGQDDIRSQHGYYSHAEHFAQSYVYRISQKKLESKINANMTDGIIGWKRYIYDKGKTLKLDNKTLKDSVGRIKYGYCIENKDVFPDTCIEQCKFCPNFVFKPAVNEQNEAMDWLSDSSMFLDAKIRESINLMKDLSISISKSFSHNNDDLLKTTSRKLLTYMDTKAMLDSNLMEVDIFGEEEK